MRRLLSVHRRVRVIGRHRVAVVVAALVFLLLAVEGGPAFAYWTRSGAGTGHVSTGLLGAPTSVAGISSDATVAVTWSGGSTPNGGSVTGYYVQRLVGATPSNACGSSPASLLAAVPTSCNDTGVSAGTYTYKVTAVFRTWTATSAASASVAVAPLDHFQVGAPASATAGSAFSITVTAKDTSNNTMTSYTGAVHFSTSDLNSPALPADYTFVGSDHGSHTFANAATLKTAGAQSVSVKDTVRLSVTGSASVTVNPSTASKLVLTAATTSPGAGAADNLTITAQDPFGNTATTYAGSKALTFGGADSIGGNAPTVSSGSGTPVSFGSATPITFTNGVSSVSGASNGVMKLYKAQTATITVTDGSLNNGPGVAVTVSAGARAGIVLTNVTTSPTPGVTCGGAVGSVACSSTGESNTPQSLVAGLALADQYQNVVTNTTGTALTVDLATTGNGSGTPSGTAALSVPTAGSSTAQFTLTRANGNNKSVTLTATVHGSTQTLTVTLSS